jgi:hypothetical protein
MKKNAQLNMLLSAILVGGVLFSGLFCAYAQGSERAEDFQAEETLYENLEEESLAEHATDFPGRYIISDGHALYANRCFAHYMNQTAAPTAACISSWMIPLRI